MSARGIEEIKFNGQIIAIIIYHQYSKDGIDFFTPADFSQQLGYMKRGKGYKIQEHIHNLQVRQIKYTQETLFVRKGKVRISFYSADKKYFASRELETGDVILLASGGHGLEFLEETELVEVKQGPYTDNDKVRFEGIIEKD